MVLAMVSMEVFQLKMPKRKKQPQQFQLNLLSISHRPQNTEHTDHTALQVKTWIWFNEDFFDHKLNKVDGRT